MLDKAFELAVVFSAVDHMTGPMNRMAGQMGVLDERSRALQQRMNGFKNMAFVGGAITMAGGALVGKMEQGLDKAGEFLSKMVTVKDTVNATADQMDRIQKTIRSSSGLTIFGVMDTAEYAKKLATSGYAANQVDNLLPLFTQYAEVQKLGKGSDPLQSITEAIGAAHSVGAYDPEQVKDFLNKFNKGTFMQPGSSSEFADTFKYLAPIGSGLGVSSDDMITLSALTNRMGLNGSMGGTNAADMVLRSIPGLLGGKVGSKKDSRQVAALKNMGLDGKIFDQNGKFLGVENFIQQLQSASKGRSPTEIAKNYHDIFGMQGMRLADLLSTKNGQEQLDAVVKQMKEMKSIQEQQHDQNQGPLGQMLQLKTNIENIKLGVWIELAKIMTPLFKDANEFVNKIQEFTDAHPRVAKMAAEFMVFAAGTALTVGPLLLITGALGYLKTSGYVGTGFKLMGMAMKGASGPVLLMAGAGYFLYKAWKNDWGGIREKVKALTDWAIKELPKAAKNAKDFAKDFGLIDGNGKVTPFAAMLAGAAGLLKLIKDLRAAQFLFNATALLNPWLVMGVALIALITHWDDVKAAVDKATESVRKFFGTDKSNNKEAKVEQAYDKFKDPNYKPSNPDGVIRQAPSLWDKLVNYDKAIHGVGHNAAGTDYWRGGLTWVGEKGPELLDLPGGSKITPNHKISDYLGEDPYSHAPAMARSGGARVDQGLSIEKGAIVVNAAPNHSADDIAERVMVKIMRKTRDKSWSRPTRVIPGVR